MSPLRCKELLGVKDIFEIKNPKGGSNLKQKTKHRYKKKKKLGSSVNRSIGETIYSNWGKNK